jgi:hypothetical protein
VSQQAAPEGNSAHRAGAWAKADFVSSSAPIVGGALLSQARGMPSPPPLLSDAARAARRARARRRKVAASLVTGLVVVAAAGVAIAETRGWPFLRGPLQRALEREAKMPVDLGGPQDRFVLKLLGRASLNVSTLTLVAAPGFRRGGLEGSGTRLCLAH